MVRLHVTVPNQIPSGIDCDFADNKSSGNGYTAFFNWNTFNADNAFASKWWTRLYRIISMANTIIDRAEQPTAVWANEAEKKQYRWRGQIFKGV